MDITHEITKLIKQSPRRDSLFRAMKEQLCDKFVGIRILCPTRWTVRADSLNSILENYSILLDFWQEAVDIVADSEMKARILGVSYSMKSFNFLFGICLGHFVLRFSDNLSRSLQSTHMSAVEGQHIANITLKQLKALRNDESFDKFWDKVQEKREQFSVGEAVLPRKRKVPKKLDDGFAPNEFLATTKDLYRQIYFEALDTITSTITDRFDQPGYQVNTNLH